MTRRLDRDAVLRGAAVVVPIVYVLITGYAMGTAPYDLWGSLVMAPLLALAALPIVRRLFRSLHPHLVPIAMTALAAHMAGSVVRYWVAFDAYGGSADAGRYHEAGAQLAQSVRDSPLRLGSVIPTPTGTVFIEKLTGLVYTFVGSSKMAGFLVFGWLAFIGSCLFVRAATVGIRELDQRRYAVVVLVLPSLVFWPSSIGKEAWMTFSLGVASYGLARVFTRQGWTRSIVISGAGLGAAACVRPHVAAIWLVAAAVASFVSLVLRRGSGASGQVRLIALGTVIVAIVGAMLIGRFAVSYLDPGDDQAVGLSDKINSILDSTEGRTTQGGSSFTPPSTSSPAQWPYAIVRTLTRPLLFEANTLTALVPAAEMTALLVLAVLSLDRLASLPLVFARRPYIWFTSVCTALFGLAFANIGNLGILARQRSLIMPLLVLPLCLLPIRTVRSRPTEVAAEARPLVGVRT